MARRLWLFATAVGMIAMACPAGAHPLAPSLLELRPDDAGHVEVRWKTPRARAVGAEPAPILPETCRQTSEPRAEQDDLSFELRWTIDCGAPGLVGRRVGVEGLAQAGTVALVRLAWTDGRRLERVVTAQQPWLEVPERPTRSAIVRDLGELGVRHILGGADHLLFVFGLVLLSGSFAALAKTVSAFTLGHSITLSLAALGWIFVPQAPIEVAIAVSVLVLAIELAQPGEGNHWMRRRSWLMAASFGLLHGLGFAAALAEAGLPRDDIPLALLSFNVGIEIGQLVFVGCVYGAGRYVLARLTPLPRWVGAIPVYVMGTLAAYWCFERAVALF